MAASYLIFAACLASAPAAAADAVARADSAVLFVADGLGWGHLQTWLEARRLEGRPARMEVLWREGAAGTASVRPLDALVPESAGGASLLATGAASRNRAVSQAADGSRPATLLERAAAAGLSAGLVTTGRLTHAVPAPFLTHAASRDPEDALVEPILGGPATLLLGGGADVFGPEGVESARARGWTGARDAAQLAAARGGKVLGLFAPDYFPYTLDRGSAPPVPRLAELTAAGLRLLPGRRLLVVDARLIDEASHNNDLAAVLAELDELDEAVGAVLDAPDAARTLVVLTSPHDTGGPAVVSAANPLDWTEPARLRAARGQKGSFRRALAELWRRESAGETVDAAAVRSAVVPLVPAFASAPEGAARDVASAFGRGAKSDPFHHAPAAAALARGLETVYRVRWLTGTHSNLPVPLFALGPGASRFAGWLTAERASSALAESLGL